MSTTNTPQPSEEVDLGQLFKLIGNAFQRLFQFIGSIFNKLFLAFVWLVFFTKKHAVILLISAVAGLALGFILDKISPPTYKSSILKKILMAKYKVGLNNYKPIETKNLVADLSRSKDDILYSKLMQNAITVLKNNNATLPIKDLELKNIAYIEMGDSSGDTFLKTLKKYTKITPVSDNNLDGLIRKLKQFNLVIIGFHKSNSTPWKPYKFTNKELVWLQEIARTNEVVLNVFSKPYTLDAIKSFSNFESVVVGYQNSRVAQELTAQILFGALSATGKLPVSISNSMYKVGHGFETSKIDRLSYGNPESVGMSRLKLSKLDSVANFAIEDEMTPGIQLLVARKGKVIYNKNFGYHTYSKQRKVSFEDLYDVASLTKILVTLPLLMELVEHGSVNLDDRLGDLLPKYKTTNKSDITLKEMLSHFARLKPWIPFYKSTLDSVTNTPISKFFSSKKSNFSNLNFKKIPNILGVLNLTPDSFSDGGKFNKKNKGVSHAINLYKTGASLVDVGGESTRPGSKPVNEKQEWNRINKILKLIVKKIPISLDTRKSRIMENGIRMGVKLINDISGLSYDPNTINILKKYKIPFVIQHSVGTPENMQKKAKYKNELLDIYDYF